MGGVARPHDRRHRPEGLLVEGRHPGLDPEEDRRGVEPPLAGQAVAAGREPRPGLDRPLHLVVEIAEQVFPGHGADVGRAVHGVAHLELLHPPDQLLLEAVGHGLVDDEALGRDAALAGVDGARPRRLARRRFRVGVGEDDERVGAAELEDGLLEAAPGLGGDLHAGVVAAGQGHRAHQRVADQLRHPRGGDEQGGERAVGEAGVAEGLLDRERGAGDVAGVLEQGDVARHQGRRGEAEDLPEGEVPRHDGEHRPERVEAHVAPRRVGLARLGGEEARGVLRVVLAAPCALLHLRLALRDGLAHLERHQARGLRLLHPQHACRLAQALRALREGARTPAEEGLPGVPEHALERGGRRLLERLQHLAAAWVDRRERHVLSLCPHRLYVYVVACLPP